MLISIETHITCDFPGRVQSPYPPSGSAHGLFLMVPWVGLPCVIVVFPDHTHLFYTLICCYR